MAIHACFIASQMKGFLAHTNTDIFSTKSHTEQIIPPFITLVMRLIAKAYGKLELKCYVWSLLSRIWSIPSDLKRIQTFSLKSH